MATNAAVKKALLAKLNVTPQRLSQLAQKRKQELPMSTEQAVYTLAHENGIDLSKQLTKEETSEVRALVSQLRAGSRVTTAASNGRAARAKKATPPKPVLVTIAGVNVEKLPGMTAAHAKEAKLMAEKVYPTLYVFENSLRDVIERVLKAQFGADWWTTAVPGKVQTAAKDHKAAEKKDPWHGQRGSREIEYVFLSHLWDIIKHQWKCFKDLFPNQAWAETLITSDMNVSRRVVAHMTPLSADDVKNIEAAFRKWAKQLKAVEHLLP
jgi:Swt1-like HEPN